MRLLILVICVMLERYGEHFERIRCFSRLHQWTHVVETRLSKVSPPWLLAAVTLPILLLIWLVKLSMGGWLWGSMGVLLDGILFFYCLGPQNVFQVIQTSDPFDAEVYFEKVNRQCFGVMFWFSVIGIWGALCYRLLDLMSTEERFVSIAGRLFQYLDWIPARLTAVLYLLIGNFQQAYPFLLGNGWSGVQKNQMLLAGCGLRAVRHDEQDEVNMQDAQHLVWRAIILFLVLIALMTLAAWL